MDNKEDLLKQKIGFKTAFMATVGFYVAQTLMSLLGLVVLAIIGWTLLYFLVL